MSSQTAESFYLSSEQKSFLVESGYLKTTWPCLANIIIDKSLLGGHSEQRLCTLQNVELISTLQKYIPIFRSILGNYFDEDLIFVELGSKKENGWNCDHSNEMGLASCALSLDIVMSKFETEPNCIIVSNGSHFNFRDKYYVNEYWRQLPDCDELAESVVNLDVHDILIRHPLLVYKKNPGHQYITLHSYFKEVPQMHPTYCYARQVLRDGVWTYGYEGLCKNQETSLIPYCDCKNIVNIGSVLQSEILAKPWLSGSKCFRSISQWVERREFVVSAFVGDGTVLDIGCANGFFLACLSVWSPHRLIPYGIEVDGSVQRAHLIFPDFSHNFVQIGLFEFLSSPELPEGFPASFDYIYWNVWSNFQFEESSIEVVSDLLSLLSASGRLILGLYDSNRHANLEKIETLKQLGFNLNIQLCEFDGHVSCWIQRTK